MTHVFIGLNSIIMPNVVIGDNVVIAAGSIVTKNIESNQVAGGSPAKFLSSFDSYVDKLALTTDDYPWKHLLGKNKYKHAKEIRSLRERYFES
jgi:serine acetyltransferase